MKATSRNTARQLQIWNDEAQRYEPHAAQVADRDEARRIANGRGWRIADPDRSLEPHYRPPRRLPPDRTAEQIQSAYLDWAIGKGLTSITAWNGRGSGLIRARFPGAVRFVSLDDFDVEHVEMPEPVSVMRARSPRRVPVILSFYASPQEIAA
jgi:hypothetical protein